MNGIEVKKEIDDLGDIDEYMTELTNLLDEVKREETDETESQPTDVEEILKRFADDDSSDSADDADIQKLQELLKEKQRQLSESDEKLKRKSRRSSTPDRGDSRKKKKHEPNRKSEEHTDSGHDAKRQKAHTSQNEIPTNEDEISKNQKSDTATSKAEEPATSVKMQKLPTEEELENLLQLTDEEPCGSNQIMDTVSCSTSPIQFAYEANPAPEFNNFYDAGHTEHFPVQEEEDQLECLPVVNSAGFSGMPMFKRIKLERPGSESNEASVAAIEETPREKRQRIFERCMSLLERLEFAEPSGKFIFTPTVTRVDAGGVCNSTLQRISNVHYDFQSIGPQLNLSDWGLREIGGANGRIAKAVGISADLYYSKIKQKEDTMAGKLIKVETDRHEKENHTEIDIEEPNLSTFYKSSVTQTDPLVCQKCAARSRIVGHSVGVQAKAYSSSFGTQTRSTGDDHSEVSAGLSDIQLRALYKFAQLIRESTVHPSIDMFQTRAMEIYNIIQNESKLNSPTYHAPSRESSRDRLKDERRTVPPSGPVYPPQIQNPSHMQRPYSHDRTRPVSSVGASHSVHMPPSHMPPPVQSFHSPNTAMHRPPPRDPRQASMNPPAPQAYWNPSPGEHFPSYQTHGMPGPVEHAPNGPIPRHQGPPPTNYGYPPPPANDKRVSYGRGYRL